MAIANGFMSLFIVTKIFILDVAAVLDQSMLNVELFHMFYQKFVSKRI